MTKWNRLKEKLPTGDGPFLYFPVKVVAGHSIQISNGDYLRGPYVDREEVQWAEIEKPDGYQYFEDKRWKWDK